MILLDHFAKATLFSRSPISSHFLLGSPLPPTPDTRILQLKVPCLAPEFPCAKCSVPGDMKVGQLSYERLVNGSARNFCVCHLLFDQPSQNMSNRRRRHSQQCLTQNTLHHNWRVKVFWSDWQRMPEPVKIMPWKILPALSEQLVRRSLLGVFWDSTRLFVNKLWHFSVWAVLF